MPAIQQTADLTENNLGFNATPESYRAAAGSVFASGACVKFVSRDKQVYPDLKTVDLASTNANQQLIAGLVSASWPGFDGAGGNVGPSPNARGTKPLSVIIAGYHPGALIDQSGAAAAAITNETPLIPSRATAGRMQGVATAVGGLGTAAVASLPSAGLCSNLTAGALVQASQIITIAGAPAQGDVVSATLQIPYTTANPGVVQTKTVSVVAGAAPTATTVAVQLAAAINADPTLKKFYLASNAAGVVTVASIGSSVTSAPFAVTFAGSYNGTTIVSDQFSFNFGGSAANGATVAAAAVGGSTATVGGGALAGGVGYFGSIPAIVV